MDIIFQKLIAGCYIDDVDSVFLFLAVINLNHEAIALNRLTVPIYSERSARCDLHFKALALRNYHPYSKVI